MVVNQRTISSMAASPSEGLQDGTDSIHSGIIKGLESFAYDRMIVEHGGFAISAPGGSTLNTVTLTNPIKYMFDGKMHTYGSDLTVNTVAAHGTHARYDWVVLDYNSGGTPHIEIIQGTAASTPKVSDFNSDASGFDKFIPVALIAMVGGSANGVARTFQMFTLDKNDLSLTVADDGASAGTMVEAMSITSASGVTTFENKVTDKDIVFKVSDDGVPTEALRIDGATARIGLGGDFAPGAMLHLKSSTTQEPEIRIENTNADAQEAQIRFLKNTANPAASDDIGIIRFEGENDAGANHLYAYIMSDMVAVENNDEAGRMLFYVSNEGSTVEVLRMTGGYTTDGGTNVQTEVVINDSHRDDIDFRVESDAYNMIHVDASNNSISLGGNDSAKIGFYAATPIVTPTIAGGDLGGSAEATLIATALSNLGLINIT